MATAFRLAKIGVISAYSFLVSCRLLLVLKHIPGIIFVSDDAEILGLDLDQFFDEDVGD